MTEYIGNAKIISPSELPKIGDKLYDGDACISVEFMDVCPEEPSYNDYIFYRACYTDLSRYFDYSVNIYHFTYAIKRNEFIEFWRNKQ